MAWPAPRSPDGRRRRYRVPEGGGLVGHVEPADIGAGRDDLVDPVEDLVGERDVHAGEQVVELLHRARPDDRAGHPDERSRTPSRRCRHRQARLLGKRDDLLDGVEPALVAHMPENGGAAQVGPLALADAPGEQPLRERAPHHDAHPVALGHGQHLGLDAAVEVRVGRLLGAEPLQSAPFGDPLGLDDVRRQAWRTTRSRGPCRRSGPTAPTVFPRCRCRGPAGGSGTGRCSRAPPELRFVLATRHDVRLGLHRLRLEGELAEIRARTICGSAWPRPGS